MDVVALSRTWHRLRRRALRRLRASVWLLAQTALAAVAAWLLALHVAGHEDPFFAPMAAVSALSTSLVERGLTALRLLFGVILGITIGELAVGLLGGGYASLAVATFGAMALARMFGGVRLVVVQAAAGAILTVVSADGQIGINRLIDALIGAGVALLFSQLLFAPEPVALLRRAQKAALADMVDGLEMTARALERDVAESAERAMTLLRDLRDRLTELRRVRRLSTRAMRHELVWRSRRKSLARESAFASHLDLLGGSCLMLARTALFVPASERSALVASVRELASALTDLANGLDDRSVRQSVADRAFRIMRQYAGEATEHGSVLAPAIIALRIVAADIMVYAGVDVAEAREALRRGTNTFEVLAPPPSVRWPIRWNVPWRRG
jgi:uncharacterized membrane protein YgaE (UPF0421/DUF939 family)